MRLILFFISFWACMAGVISPVRAQNDIFVNLAFLDGLDISPDNILNFQVQSGMNHNVNVTIKGEIHYRDSDLKLSYQFKYIITPGINNFSANAITPQFSYSSNGLRELFERYKKLPQGLYEYCVTVEAQGLGMEGTSKYFNECLYHKSEDIFLINLVDPVDDAKIYEYHPILTWIVNYPFSAELTYRLRVSEIKKGQNNMTAITRNNPIFDERGLSQLSMIYPLYAKPLQKNQPYVWSVDAYYKGMLLGGSEAWKFTIIEDSLLAKVPTNQSYFEFATHLGETEVFAVDTLKLKYRSYLSDDTLHFTLLDEKRKDIKMKPAKYGQNPGFNYLDIPLGNRLNHTKKYVMLIKNTNGHEYMVPFIYINPIYLKNKK